MVNRMIYSRVYTAALPANLEFLWNNNPGPDARPDRSNANVYSPEPHEQQRHEIRRKQHEGDEEPEPDPAELLDAPVPSGRSFRLPPPRPRLGLPVGRRRLETTAVAGAGWPVIAATLAIGAILFLLCLFVVVVVGWS
jgi:hypothetical protein